MAANEIKILVVDDMATMRLRVINQLKGMGYLHIEQASDGQEAYTLLQQKMDEGNPIELVISDWNMPNMTGIELLEKLRSEKGFSSLPFVMVTAEGEKPQVLRALKSGVTDYLIKPVDKVILQEKLCGLAALRKAA